MWAGAPTLIAFGRGILIPFELPLVFSTRLQPWESLNLIISFCYDRKGCLGLNHIYIYIYIRWILLFGNYKIRRAASTRLDFYPSSIGGVESTKTGLNPLILIACLPRTIHSSLTKKTH